MHVIEREFGHRLAQSRVHGCNVQEPCIKGPSDGPKHFAD